MAQETPIKPKTQELSETRIKNIKTKHLGELTMSEYKYYVLPRGYDKKKD